MTILGSDKVPYRWFVKWVGTWSPEERLCRVARFVWAKGKPGVIGGGYSAKLSIGLTPRLLSFRRDWYEWIVTLVGIRVHYARHYGGWVS